jgi:hypothetical protein
MFPNISYSVVCNPASAPFENSPSYVRQPLERRLTPLNFIQTPPEPAITATRTAFPEELPLCPRRYSRCRDRFRTTTQRQEALLEQECRRRAEFSREAPPHLIIPSAPQFVRTRLKHNGQGSSISSGSNGDDTFFPLCFSSISSGSTEDGAPSERLTRAEMTTWFSICCK